jgi:hypothetical protein
MQDTMTTSWRQLGDTLLICAFPSLNAEVFLWKEKAPRGT